MSKEQQERLIGAVIAFIIALLSIFGYNIAVVQPAIEQTPPAQVGSYGLDCAAVVQCLDAAP